MLHNGFDERGLGFLREGRRKMGIWKKKEMGRLCKLGMIMEKGGGKECLAREDSGGWE